MPSPGTTLLDRPAALLRSAQAAVAAHNPRHARQLAEAARKASLAQRIVDNGRRKQAEYHARQTEQAGAGA